MTLPHPRAAGATPEQRFYDAFARHYAAVYRYCRRRLGDDDAGDAAAEAFTVAWKKIDRLPDDPGALPWLYAVARRVVANAERGRRRRLRLVAEATAQIPPGTAPAADAGTAVLGALSRLDPADAEVLRLAAWEGLDPREMGAVLGCSPNAAAIRLHRARRRLEAAMNETGGDA